MNFPPDFDWYQLDFYHAFAFYFIAEGGYKLTQASGRRCVKSDTNSAAYTTIMSNAFTLMMF